MRISDLNQMPVLNHLNAATKIVCFSGAGMSAESNIATFRDSGGLWEKHRIEEVATPEAWRNNPAKVLNFYNQRRKQLVNVAPNAAHLALAEIEKRYNMQIITQNVDNLHERAGSKKVLHLHGELMKAQSEINPNYVINLTDWSLNMGQKCPQGGQLRPHVVWFGEPVPAMEKAFKIVEQADLLLVIGTSLEVYPAAGLVTQSNPNLPKLIIDPGRPDLAGLASAYHLQENATLGLKQLMTRII
jgi:NAD-dependent deacetylase